MLLFTFNMTPVLRENYVFGVPANGFYKEILNSNASEYGGSGVGNMGGVHSEDIPRFEFPNSIKVTLPPLAVNVYRLESEVSESAEQTIESESELSERSEPELSELSELKESKSVPEFIPEEKGSDLKVIEEENISGESRIKEGSDLKKEIPKKSADLTEEDMEEKLKEIMRKIKKF